MTEVDDSHSSETEGLHQNLEPVSEDGHFRIGMGPVWLTDNSLRGPNGLKTEASRILGPIKVKIGSGAECLEKKLSECRDGDLRVHIWGDTKRCL